MVNYLRANGLLVAVIALQLVVIGLVASGVGQPTEVYASNLDEIEFPEDYSASEAAAEARQANEQLRSLRMLGVNCSP